MSTINSSTLRRLQKLKQSPSVWEGDRRSLPKAGRYSEGNSNLVIIERYVEEEPNPQCILWVDGSMGMVRAMDVVDPTAGQEAFVRALLQAMERPQSPAQPGRPQKILVRDRSLQFYLRGILQGLDIAIEHVEHLPLIDEIFANIVDHANTIPPSLPPERAPALYHQANVLWHKAPWEYLWDYQVLSVELHQWDIETLYAVLMGRLGLEKGAIFYRSQASLVQFRQRISEEEREEGLEETFLQQDCLFTLFESQESLTESELRHIQSLGWSTSEDEVYPIFGSLHPLEGGRPFLYEEEANALYVAISAVNAFIAEHQSRLRAGKFESLQTKTNISFITGETTTSVNVTVRGLPELAKEIQSISSEDSEPLIHEELWPDNVLFQLLGIPWGNLTPLRSGAPHRFLAEKPIAEKGDALSGLLIQTSRPKALELIQQIENFGGIKAICFNPAETFFGESCELGLLVLGNGDLHLFGEFDESDRDDEKILKKWKQRCRATKGSCAVIVAMGITGASRGNPSPQHILGYYEVELIPAKELGLGTLRAQPVLGFELDL